TTTASLYQYEILPDRKYKYDVIGQLKSDNWDGGPSYHNFQYDVWGNTTSITGIYWGENLWVENPAYVNNRNPNNVYDPDGRVLGDGGYYPFRNGVLVFAQNERKYDAAGRMVEIRYGMDEDDSQGSILHLRDGLIYDIEGHLVKQWRLSAS